MSSYDTTTVYTSPEYRRACSLRHRYEHWLFYQSGPDSVLKSEQALLDAALCTLDDICDAYHSTCTQSTRAKRRARFVELAIWCFRWERHVKARRARTFRDFADFAGFQVFEVEEAWAMDMESMQALIKRLATRRYAAEEIARRQQEQRWRRGESSQRPTYVYLQPSREVLIEEAIASLSCEETVLIEEAFEILSTPVSPSSPTTTSTISPSSPATTSTVSTSSPATTSTVSTTSSADSSSSTSTPTTSTSPPSTAYDTDTPKPASS